MATKKKPTKKATAKKATAKKATAKKPAKKATAKKPAKKATAKKPAKKATAKKGSAKKATAEKAATGHVLPALRRPLDLASLAASYRDGDALAHPVTAEQMAQVRVDGLRGDGEIVHVEDDHDVAPCRLVDHGEGRYSLCFDDFRMPQVPLFSERGLAGNGYTWEAVVDSLLRLRRAELVPQIAYDSEGSMFVAVGARQPLLAVAQLIQAALGDPTLLKAAVDAADPDRLE
jgi:hypothetical protein